MSKISAAFRSTAQRVAEEMKDIDLSDSFKLPVSDSGILYNLKLVSVEADVGIDKKTGDPFSYVRLQMKVLDGEYTDCVASFYYRSTWGWSAGPFIGMAAAVAKNPKILTNCEFVEAASILAGVEGQLCAEWTGGTRKSKGEVYPNYAFNRIIAMQAPPSEETPEAAPPEEVV